MALAKGEARRLEHLRGEGGKIAVATLAGQRTDPQTAQFINGSQRSRSRSDGLVRIGCHCAFTQLSDPVSFTDTSEKETRSGLPSAVPWWSVEIRRGPAFW
jgi:hypothetical protein